MLCDLAVAMLEELQPELRSVELTWTVVDVGTREGVLRQAQIGERCSRMPAVPSLVINGNIAFDNIPDMESLVNAIDVHPRG